MSVSPLPMVDVHVWGHLIWPFPELHESDAMEFQARPYSNLRNKLCLMTFGTFGGQNVAPIMDDGSLPVECIIYILFIKKKWPTTAMSPWPTLRQAHWITIISATPPGPFFHALWFGLSRAMLLSYWSYWNASGFGARNAAKSSVAARSQKRAAAAWPLQSKLADGVRILD